MPATGASARAPRPRWLRVLRALAAILVAALLVSSPWWGRAALSSLAFFHVRRVEFEGVRHARPAELVRLLAVDTLQSVWQPLPVLAERVAKHPLVLAATVERRLPGTLVVHVEERRPVAQVMADGVLRPADVAGRLLPIDPTRAPLDLPIVAARDSALLQLLDGLQQHAPALHARVTRAGRSGPDEFRLLLGDLVVRTRADVTVARLRDILPVEADLARNQLRAVELDLRFRDQVIARQP